MNLAMSLFLESFGVLSSLQMIFIKELVLFGLFVFGKDAGKLSKNVFEDLGRGVVDESL